MLPQSVGPGIQKTYTDKKSSYELIDIFTASSNKDPKSSVSD